MEQRKENCAQKRIYSAFLRGTEEVRDDTNSWFWMKEQELFMAEQDQLLQTRWVKHSIDRTNGSPKCRMCGKMDENVSHLVSEYNELAPNGYKKLRHDKLQHCCIGSGAKTYGFETHEKIICQRFLVIISFTFWNMLTQYMWNNLKQ